MFFLNTTRQDQWQLSISSIRYGLCPEPSLINEETIIKATAELQVIPLGEGVSVREQVTRVLDILKGYDFIIETHASGTDIEGDLDDIMAAVKQVHQLLHDEGTVRILSYLKLETRTDKIPTLAGKRID